MGSGCTGNSPNFKCTDIVPSHCVKWQGDASDILDICKGDSLTEVLEVLILKLISYAEGTGITLPTITFDCNFLSQQMSGKTNDLTTLFGVIFDSLCSIQQSVTDIEDDLSTPVSYNTGCLTPTANTTPAVVQSIINAFCALKDEVDIISDGLENTTINTTISTISGDLIKNALTSCNGGYGIEKSGSGANVQVSINALVPPCSAFWVWNSAMLQYFDATGKGNAGSPFCGTYIMNGLNGTINMMGYTAAGATNLPGIQGTLDTLVSPTASGDLDYAASIGDVKGKVKVALTESQNGSHTHAVTDPKHYHISPSVKETHHTDNNSGNPNYPAGNISGQTYGNPVSTLASTGISIASSGSGSPHENRQPTKYGFWITRLI